MAGFDDVERDARGYGHDRGIALSYAALPLDTPAEFDGVSITINRRQPLEWRAHYLVHSIGSIVGWCLDAAGVAAMYHELRDAKSVKDRDPGRLAQAVSAFQDFEERVSRFSVQLLIDLGHGWAVPAFTLFFRADLDAMTRYHREGRAPRWPEHLAAWQRDVLSGSRAVDPFPPVPIPPFRVARFEKQQVKQER
jgi:hypothetical protein